MRKIPTTTILFFTFLTNPVFAIEFTPEYLHGEWCYLYMDVSNQKNKQNTNWDFKADGKLFAQPARHSKKMQYQHNWKSVDDKLKI